MPIVDPVQTIAKIYQEGMHKVPYPIFLKCFNTLMEDPLKCKPKKPSEQLEPFFRAACQAIDLGVIDSLGRAEDRQKEFYDHVYPLWKQGLPAAKFQPYQDILDAKVRQHMEQQRHEQQKRAGETHMEEMDKESVAKVEEELHQQFAALSEVALEHEMEEGPGIEEKAEAEAQAQAAEKAKKHKRAVVMEELDELVEAIMEGQLPLNYADPKSKKPFVAYMYRGEKVVVHLLKSARAFYLTLTCEQGIEGRASAGPAINQLLSERGYTETEPLVYEKKEGANVRLKLGRQTTGLALRHDTPFTEGTMAQAIQEMNTDLAEVLRELHGASSAAAEQETEESY